MLYLNSQEFRNLVHIIKYVVISRFLPNLKLEVAFVESLLEIFTSSDLWQNEGAKHISNNQGLQ